jgi:hypothetical protein
MFSISEGALEKRARRAARSIGLIARKTRWRAGSIDNYGGFALIDTRYNCIVAGSRYELSPEDVIEYCNE